jgi:hypothetical protein
MSILFSTTSSSINKTIQRKRLNIAQGLLSSLSVHFLNNHTHNVGDSESICELTKKKKKVTNAGSKKLQSSVTVFRHQLIYLLFFSQFCRKYTSAANNGPIISIPFLYITIFSSIFLPTKHHYRDA